MPICLAQIIIQKFKRILKKSSSVMMMISVPICMGIIAVSETLVPWFLGEKFIPATPILKLFATLVVIDSIKDFYGTQILIPMKKQKFYNVIMITGVLMNLVLRLCLYYPLSGIGGLYCIYYFRNFYCSCLCSKVQECIAL